jgi:exosortase family protein XrtM
MKIQTVLPNESESNTKYSALNIAKMAFSVRKNAWFQFMLFVGCYVLLDYCYFIIPIDLFQNVIYYHGVVAVCGDLINFFVPLEQVIAQKNHLLSAKADLEIVRGCDGAGVLFLLLAAILAFPASIARKLTGIALAIGLIYSINILRIGLLYFVIAYKADWFMLIHTYVAPTFMVLVGCGYFAYWALGSQNNQYESA